MFRYELDKNRKIMVLVVHGTQDGWEAKSMRIDWPLKVALAGSDWNFILDLSEYVTPNGAAVKDQKKLASLIAGQTFAKKMLVRANNPDVNLPFEQGVNFDVHPDFLSAWRSVGGDPRNVRIPAPSDGTRYPANNPPPAVG